MWNDNTFYFTAYTGSAAAAFGGITTCKATFLNKRSINDEDRKTFQGVRILIIDEVSFLTDAQLLKMDRILKKLETKISLLADTTWCLVVIFSNSNRLE